MPLQLPDSAELVVSAAEVEAAYDRMAAEINGQYGEEPLLLLTVMNGGMIAAAHLAVRLNMPVQLDYLHVSRYRGATRGGDELHWIHRPQHELADRNLLIVDDILDEGPTLGAIIRYCEEHGAASVRSAVLVAKRHDRRVPGIHADFVGLEVEDRYLFGCGMDYKDDFRHLPAIYAIDP
ncbi:MAG: hypoxanthine-guanine phosphoribosyltransferase [Xanthomonadales bacterium]|nr:hypoxanthine-guanine phosphoribosyltransferase [Xanthomonadales bacterium]